jgi:hypothetical protein
MSDNYGYISPEIFNEPEYRDMAEILIATYIILNRDMAGVCPVYLPLMAKACRTSRGRIRQAISYFESIGKLEIGGKDGENFTHIWWKSGIFHSLYKGKYSESQVKSVGFQVRKWHSSGVFGQNFTATVSQLYGIKYGIDIPIPKDLPHPTPTPTRLSYLNSTDLNLSKTPAAPENPTDQKLIPPPRHTLSDIGIMLKAIGYMARRSPKLETDLAINCGNLRKRLEDWSSSAGGMTWTMFKIGCYYEQFFANPTNGADPLEDIKLPMNYLYTLIYPDKEKGQQTVMESPSGIAFRDEYTVEHWARTFMPEMFK